MMGRSGVGERNSTGCRRQFEVLLVEDSAADAHLTIAAFCDGNCPVTVRHVVDGVQAMNFLRREDSFSDAPRPALVLLDLNMPRKDGREVLVEIKTDPELRTIPVVVLTTSSDSSDVNFCYGAGANAFLIKPVDFDRFTESIKALEMFWFAEATLPGR